MLKHRVRVAYELQGKIVVAWVVWSQRGKSKDKCKEGKEMRNKRDGGIQVIQEPFLGGEFHLEGPARMLNNV